MHGEQYGTLVDFDVDSAHGWQQAGFPRAVITLTVQQTIASALSKAVDAIVANAGPTGNAGWTALVSQGLHSAHDKALWSTYYHQKFAPPAKLDPDMLLQKIRNHLDMLVDETELMQTSPEHMRQFALGCKAQTFTVSGDDKAEHQWARVDRMISIGSTNDLICWLGVQAELENLKSKLAECESSTIPGASLTKEADAAMKCFGQVISLLLKVAVQGDAKPALLSVKVIRDYVLGLARGKQEKSCSSGCEPDDASVETLDIGKKTIRIMGYVQRMIDVVRGDLDEIHLVTLIRLLKHELRDVHYNKSVENFLSSIALMDELRTLWY
jgi:hypothetical protein